MKIKVDPNGIWQEYLNDLDYKIAMGFAKNWPMYTNFIEGKQWPAPTEETKYMPRPVINICDQTVENKRSNILSQQLKMQFRLKEVPDDETMNEIAADFSDMSAETWYDIMYDTLLKEKVNDAISLGTGITHYYFDNDYVGGMKLKYVGKMRGENIDPMDLILGNNRLKPYEIQKQPFIGIKRRKNYKDVVETAKKHGSDHELIQPDKNIDTNERYDSARVESRNGEEVTTITKYYKVNGEVWWTEITEKSVVRKPKRLSPNDIKFTLYPVDMLGMKRRRKCAYYRSFIEDIIPNQKALNWGLGMQLLSVQQTAWPKIIAKVGALTQQITNSPGEILIDKSPLGTGDGFKYMQMPNTPNTVPVLMQTLMEMTRSVTGVTEVSTGETIGANMAAAAIIALQNQAQRPNDDYMQDVVSSVKREGEIWEMFFKCFYNFPRYIKSKDEEGNEISKLFDSSKAKEVEFDLMVDVGPSSVFSESLQVSVLDNYAERQWIDKYQHAKYMPKTTLPQGLREELEKEKVLADEQQDMMQGAQDIMSQLTPEEQAYLQQNPQLLDELGGTNEML